MRERYTLPASCPLRRESDVMGFLEESRSKQGKYAVSEKRVSHRDLTSYLAGRGRSLYIYIYTLLPTTTSILGRGGGLHHTLEWWRCSDRSSLFQKNVSMLTDCLVLDISGDVKFARRNLRHQNI